MDEQLIEKIVEYAGDRLKVHGDILHYAQPFLVPDHEWNIENSFTEDEKTHLCAWRDCVVCMCRDSWNHEAIGKETESYCESQGLKLKDIVHPIRWALTGSKTGFSLFHTIELFGSQRTSDRIDLAIMGHTTTRVLEVVRNIKSGFVLERQTVGLLFEIPKAPPSSSLPF